MSEFEVIQSAIESAARRRRRARALDGIWVGLLVGAAVSFLMAGLYHVLPLPLWVAWSAALAPLPCVVAGVIIGGWRKSGLAETARWVDGRRHMQERLSTALEVASDERAGRWRELVVRDAAEHLRDFDSNQLVTYRLPARIARWTVLLLVLTFALGFVPEYRSKATLQKVADRQNIRETGRQLADLTRRDLQKRAPALEPTEKALNSVMELGSRMEKQTLTRSDALKELSSATQKLKDQMQELGKNPDLKRMEDAARSGGGDRQASASLQKQMDSMQKQLGNANADPQALDKMQKDLERLAETAKSAAADNSPASQAAREKMSQSLAAMSKQMQDMGMNLPQLDEAIAALNSSNPDLFLKDLQQSVKDLEKMRDQAKELAQMRQQMDKIGKDLAEQLKNGQPEAAQATLQKMMDQLKQSSLPPDQLQKMMAEVSKAVDPASHYGKVADYLSSAASQMKSGDKSAAGESLAAASKELDKLMAQMADAQQMADTLANLEKASQCVGTGQCWGQCTRPGTKGGKPGRGVGTWAEENNDWLYDGQSTGSWDNSGIKRPDQASRGLTDRGPTELNDALKPDKVKGQFSPGGPMPSITLKGVSIKGESKVSYEEAATAAQADAQSALSQEKVPRAYQGAVKDYFDDLKQQ
jgi:predicted  nucleic acid-binding Zn-ribbon protein